MNDAPPGKTAVPQGKILIVDDEESMRFFLSETLAGEGYRYRAAASGAEALGIMKKEPFDLAILDYNMPGWNGLETLAKLREIDPDIVAILITAYGSQDLAYSAMDKGAYDYFTKPLDIGEVRVVARRALERRQLLREVRSLRSNLEEKFSLGRILGKSRAIREAIERVEKVAGSDVSVLVLGESGTGKELIAQAIHANSPRRHGPFVKVNCAAVPQDLLEAEFFGFEKGAFTGALKRKLGKFEQASGGTLFLDEIGDMPAATQMKILRALQENEVERLGGETSVKIDIRVVAATNKDLKRAVGEGDFREELFYRLNVVSLQLPPLRDRKEDIPILANHFLKVYNEKFNKGIGGISREGTNLLTRYSWPGNVRELENVVQRAIVLAYNNILGEKDLLDVYPPLAGGGEPDLTSPRISLEDKVQTLVAAAEKRLILEALNETNWKRQEAAGRLRVSRKTLHNKMKKYGLGD
ncbi:MAG: sigma-54-dependent Fis family transcriptional regulator [Nitrospinae bacterium]|nr:sigma-54-dependent Fis family transcriptional regulator [Nitrospinota bacterium]